MPAIAGHRLLPHKVNQRANIHALKRAGATTVLGFSALGCLEIGRASCRERVWR